MVLSFSFTVKENVKETYPALLWEGYMASEEVQQAFHQSYQYYQQVRDEQSTLLETLSAALETQDLNAVKEGTLQRLDHDLNLADALNEELTAYSPPLISWSLKTNKMSEVLEGAKVLLTEESTWKAFVTGTFPPSFEADVPHPVLLGDISSTYGTSQSTYLSAALIEIHLYLLGNQSQIQDLATHLSTPSIDQSAIMHVTPLPAALVEGEGAFIKNSSFYFSDVDTPMGYVFPHTGYAFGGHRFETRYPDGKPFGPEDCSSWIGKITDCSYTFSTLDQLYTYRSQLPEGEKGYIDPNWLNSDVAKEMLSRFSLVKVENPVTDIEPGQIIVMRNFETPDHTQEKGHGGHTALVVGVTEEGAVVTIGFNRDMPTLEGFGIQTFSSQSTPYQDTFFFKLNDVLPSPDLIETFLAEPTMSPLTINPVLPVITPFSSPLDEQLLVVIEG